MKKNTLRILTGLFTGLFTLSTLAGTTLSYDAVGRVSQVVEPNGQTHGFAYDTLGRVQAHQQPNATGAGTAGQVQYGYTGQGDISSVTDPRALVTSYGVNGLGDASSLSSPDTGGTTFVRDEAGNVTSVTDARGVTVQYTYDGGNRLTSVDYGDELVTFTYGANGAPGAGLPVSMTDGSGTTTWAYDRLGHVLSKTQVVASGTGGAGGATLTTSYTWGGDRLASITYPSGAVVSYDYNDGQVASISVNGIPAISNISYAPFGGPVSWVMPGAAGTYNKAYDTSGRVTSYSYDFGSKALEWDASSRLTAQTNPDGTRWTYGYDNLNRLTASNELNRGTRSYKYDLNGNRLTESNPAGTAYTYPIDAGSNRALSQIAKTQTKTYSYDAVGNTLSDSIVNLQWNNAGRLKKVTGVSQPGTYIYNGLGQRVKKSASIGAGQWANVRHFIYAEDRTSILGDYIQTIDGSGNASALSVGSELVYLEGVPVLLLRNGQVYASMPDHLGTVRTIKDSNGVVMWRWNSDAFGQSVPEEQPSGQATKFYYQFRFPGQYADGESGMIYNNARYYNPVNGRYYSSDPIGLLGGLSPYTYVRANPLGFSDRTGEYVINMLPAGDGQNLAAETYAKLFNDPNRAVVFAHGSAASLAGRRTAEEILTAMQSYGYKIGTPIEFRVCNVGIGGTSSLAAQVARLAKAEVKATADLDLGFLEFELGPAKEYPKYSWQATLYFLSMGGPVGLIIQKMWRDSGVGIPFTGKWEKFDGRTQ